MRSGFRRALCGLACWLVVLGAALISAPPALADGDPASDVLATQGLFLPQDAGTPVREQVQLATLLREAGRAGYPIRVALIASRTDLGSIGELWGQPVSYAKFLGQELSLSYRGTLLVVMPAGFGVYENGASTARDQAALSAGSLHPAGGGLASMSVDAVRQLAAVNGHRLPLPAAAAPTRTSTGDGTQWIAFAVGLTIIAVAWTLSLRARPLPRRSGGAGRDSLPARSGPR